MNVLIVDKDKCFVSAISKMIKKDSQVSKVKVYNDELSLSHTLNELETEYELGFIDLDTVSTTDFINNENTKYIVYSSNAKRIKKYINNPFIQRVFQKPINLTNLSKYLSNYCNVLTNTQTENNIMQELTSIGFNQSSKGTQYICEAIEGAIKGVAKSTKDICTYVAQKNSATSNQVLWAINNSINSMLKSNYRKTYLDFFNIIDNRKPTPKLILDYYVQQRSKLRL